MSFTSSPERPKKQPALLWNIDVVKMALEIQDEMKQKGVSKRVIFSPADSTWTMGMEFGNVKQATRIHAASMYRDSSEEKKINIKTTRAKCNLEGFQCHEVIVESEDYKATIWVAESLDFNLCKIYKMLDHCGMMRDFVGTGDWFLWPNKKGMILEVNSTKKSTGESYVMSITQLKEDIVDNSLFNLAGYKISDIPEGQHCGPIVEGK